jgi:hypothetical protein
MSLLLAFQGAPPAAEAETLAPLSVRLGYRGYSRALAYVWNPARDVDVAPIADSTYAQLVVHIPFKGYDRNPYLRNTAQDLSVVVPFDLPSFLAKPQYKPLGRNPYLWNTAQDFSFVASVEESTLAQFVVRLNIRGQWWIVPAYVFNLAPQDEDAPSIIVPGGTYIPTFRPRRR